MGLSGTDAAGVGPDWAPISAQGVGPIWAPITNGLPSYPRCHTWIILEESNFLTETCILRLKSLDASKKVRHI
jgi:hypothetical protein